MTAVTPQLSESPRILVLLPTYNGAIYLREQLDSILAQSFDHTVILSRDDGSRDESPSIIADYARRYPGRFHLVNDELGNLGARSSFSKLMEEALELDSPFSAQNTTYFALADQDDTWHPNKLQRLLDALTQLEDGHPEIPALVHGDLRVVDQDGHEIAPSMATYQGLRPERSSLAAQLISNTVTGCTALMNRALLDRSTPVPVEAIMHDWWLSLVASALGRRAYVQEPLVNYRQHGNNTIGAKEWTERNRYRMKPGLKALPKNVYHLLRVIVIVTLRLFDDEHNEAFQGNARQAKAFMTHFKQALSTTQRLQVRMGGWLSVHFAPLQRLLFRALRRL